MAKADRRASRRFQAVAVSAIGVAANFGDLARAQRATQPDKRPIFIYGERQSAIKAIAPLATLDSDAIGATGATTMSELLQAIRPLTQSASGEDPIFLLNGQRTSGYQEIGSLPPEAIDKVEVLPEPAALRFGYPPTRRVLNFITKRNFRQIEARAAVGTTTDPGSATASTNFNLTRLHKDQRFTLALESRHTSSLLQSERHLLPDPDVLFDGIGNITGVNRGEIDPALSAAAGQTVTVAAVPEDVALRSSLGAYAGSGNAPRIFDPGPYRTLVPHNDAWKVESVLADKLGGTLSGSLNLTAESSTDSRFLGPAPVTLTVPASNPFSPFSSTVLLKRYLTEAPLLYIRQTTTTLHGGGTLRGVTAGWRWDLTATADQKLVSGSSDFGIDVTAANAAIANGANPFAPLDAPLLAARLTDRGHLLTRTLGTKLVVNNTPIALPAGQVNLTATAEAERMMANSVTRGADPFDFHLTRTRTEAGLSIDVPLTSRRERVLGGIGDLSVNGSIYARRVSGFGSLADHTFGITWAPFKAVQILLQDKRSGTAPAMDKLASPVVVVPNVNIFDFVTGRTEIVHSDPGRQSRSRRRAQARALGRCHGEALRQGRRPPRRDLRDDRYPQRGWRHLRRDSGAGSDLPRPLHPRFQWAPDCRELPADELHPAPPTGAQHHGFGERSDRQEARSQARIEGRRRRARAFLRGRWTGHPLQRPAAASPRNARTRPAAWRQRRRQRDGPPHRLLLQRHRLSGERPHHRRVVPGPTSGSAAKSRPATSISHICSRSTSASRSASITSGPSSIGRTTCSSRSTSRMPPTRMSMCATATGGYPIDSSRITSTRSAGR